MVSEIWQAQGYFSDTFKEWGQVPVAHTVFYKAVHKKLK